MVLADAAFLVSGGIGHTADAALYVFFEIDFAVFPAVEALGVLFPLGSIDGDLLDLLVLQRLSDGLLGVAPALVEVSDMRGVSTRVRKRFL